MFQNPFVNLESLSFGFRLPCFLQQLGQLIKCYGIGFLDGLQQLNRLFNVSRSFTDERL